MILSELATTIVPVIQLVWDSSKMYLLWTTLHFTSINLYQYFCTNLSWWGFISSPINSQLPHCRGLKWLSDTSLKGLDTFGVIVIAYVGAKFTGLLGSV